MPVITTDKLGLETANPKPVRGVNWCGNPMKEGDSYWGETEPQPQPPVQSATQPRKKRKPLGKMTDEARKAISERMRAYWSSRRSAVDTTTKQGEN